MNCQEHNYYYYCLSLLFLFKAKLGYIKGQIQILDLYGISGLEGFFFFNKRGFLSYYLP